MPCSMRLAMSRLRVLASGRPKSARVGLHGGGAEVYEQACLAAKLRSWLQEMEELHLRLPFGFPCATSAAPQEASLYAKMTAKGPERVRGPSEFALLLYKHGLCGPWCLPQCCRCEEYVRKPWNRNDRHYPYCSTDCRYPPCECGASRPAGTHYVWHNYEQAQKKKPWSCGECACAYCGTLGLKADRGGGARYCAEKPGKSSCKWPPCTGCGTKRPPISKYQYNAIGDWTCEKCRKKK